MVPAAGTVHHRGPGVRRLVDEHHVIVPGDAGIARSAVFDGHVMSGAERRHLRGSIIDTAAMRAGRAAW